jgi:glucose-6-phosphate-specific signal transduction histidine kinase
MILNISTREFDMNMRTKAIIVVCFLAIVGIGISVLLSSDDNEAMTLLRDFARPG